VKYASSHIVASEPASADGRGITVTTTLPVTVLKLSSTVTVYVVVTFGVTIGFCWVLTNPGGFDAQVYV